MHYGGPPERRREKVEEWRTEFSRSVELPPAALVAINGTIAGIIVCALIVLNAGYAAYGWLS
jgi:hypothetical protein